MEYKQQTVSVPQRGQRVAPPANAAKGHDAVLHALQKDGRVIHITLMSGERLEGKIVGRDKFTITVLSQMGIADTTLRRQVVYKHAIESFWGDERPVREAA